MSSKGLSLCGCNLPGSSQECTASNQFLAGQRHCQYNYPSKLFDSLPPASATPFAQFDEYPHAKM